MKTFKLERATDISGVSGTGTVAQGVEFDDGSVALRWNGEWPTSVVFHDRGLVSVKAIHGHSGATSIVLDTAGDRLRRLVDAVRAPLLAELAEAAEWAKSARDFRERQIGDLRAEVERLTRERNLWQRTASDIELMVTVLTRERDEWKAARDECERQFQKQVDEVAAQMDRADTAERERDEARAKAVDGGEWTKTYGWRFRDGSPGSVDGLPTRPASPTGRLVATEQGHWHGPVRDCADGPVEVVDDDGSGT